MAKLKPSSKRSGRRKSRGLHSDRDIHQRSDGSSVTKKKPQSPEQLHFQASELLLQLQVDRALPIAQKALDRFREAYPHDPLASYPALLLLGEIYLAHGEIEESREHYRKATELDPEGWNIGASPFLWCAQLSEEGGEDSISWFERACTILRREVKNLEAKNGIEEDEEEMVKTRRQLGEALCSMTEVYMTDLSFDSDAGSKCEAMMTEAVLISPESPAVLQTLASVRISEVRLDEAKSALTRSMELWKHLSPDEVNFPDFATRISLVRLLLEVGMAVEATDVVDQLVQQDDQSVEAVYLAAWSRFLLYEKGADLAGESRNWFRRCLRLYTSVDYEDEELRKHVVEMMAKLDETLGPLPKEDEGEDAEWEDEGSVEEDGDIEVEESPADMSVDDVDMDDAANG